MDEWVGISGYSHMPGYQVVRHATAHLLKEDSYISLCGRRIDSRADKTKWKAKGGRICKRCEASLRGMKNG